MRKYFIAFLLALMLTGCEPISQAPSIQMPAVAVVVANSQMKDINIYLEKIGLLHASVSMELRPLLSGTLTDVFVNEGQQVKINEPLFKIDSRLYESKIHELEAQKAIDFAQLQLLQKKLARFKSLAAKDLVAQTEWDELEEQVEVGEASLKLDQARLNMAKVDLENCTVRSPVEGQVGKLDVYPGNVVNGSQSLLGTIAKLDPLIIEFNITEKEFYEISNEISKRSIQIEITPFEESNHIFKTGIVTFLDHHFDQKSGLLLVRGSVSNADHSLHPGQSVKVRVLTKTKCNALLVPQKAIKYNQQGPYVYVVKPDMTVAMHSLVLGDEYENDQIILEGISSSDVVVTEGHLRLWPGIKVKILTKGTQEVEPVAFT